MKPCVPDLPGPAGWQFCVSRLFGGLLLLTTLAAASPTDAEHRAFFDELFGSFMTRHDIPGVAAVLVQGDRVVFNAGYGFADIRRELPMDPQRTLFPLGSISKVFTAAAVLQMVEEGKVDLHSDIASYIAPLRYDDRFDAPITLHHLLTHTDGFDVRWLVGGAARVPEKVRPLSAVVAQLPPRVLPPGEVYLYSDVGMTLAGYVVERVARKPFADYMDENLFQRLGMRQTTFKSNREFYARDRATGYDYGQSGTLEAVPIVYAHAVPASGVTAPVADLAPFMIALLEPSTSGPRRILGEAGLRGLLQRQFSHHPSIAGTGYGFYEYFYQGRRALVHGGMLPGFTTVLVLIPDAEVGLCVAANRFDLISVLETDLLRTLLDRFLPAVTPDALPTPVIETSGAATALAGRYRCDQYSRFSIDKLFVAAGMATETEVEAEADGSLLFLPGGGRWRLVEPLVYQRDDSFERVRFQTDASGRGTRLLGSAQLMSYHRVQFWDDYHQHIPLAAGLLLLSAMGGIMSGWAAWNARSQSFGTSTPLMWTQRILAVGVAVALAAYCLGLFNSVRRLDFTSAAFGELHAIPLLQLVPLACGLAAIAQLIACTIAWRSRPANRTETIVAGAAAAATLLLFPLLLQWQFVRLPSPLVALFVRCLSPSVS